MLLNTVSTMTRSASSSGPKLARLLDELGLGHAAVSHVYSRARIAAPGARPQARRSPRPEHSHIRLPEVIAQRHFRTARALLVGFPVPELSRLQRANAEADLALLGRD